MSRVPLEQIKRMQRPDSELPPQLRHPDIREVRNTGSQWRRAYQIVFDKPWMPYDYFIHKVDDWHIQYARVEYQPRTDGILGKLLPNKPCVCIVVSEDSDGLEWKPDE